MHRINTLSMTLNIPYRFISIDLLCLNNSFKIVQIIRDPFHNKHEGHHMVGSYISGYMRVNGVGKHSCLRKREKQQKDEQSRTEEGSISVCCGRSRKQKR